MILAAPRASIASTAGLNPGTERNAGAVEHRAAVKCQSCQSYSEQAHVPAARASGVPRDRPRARQHTRRASHEHGNDHRQDVARAHVNKSRTASISQVDIDCSRRGAPYRLCLLAVTPLSVDDRLCRS